MRFVGFSSRLQDELEGYRSKKDVVELRDCEVKTARRGVEKFKLMLKSDTRIKKSPEKVDISKVPGNECPVVIVKDIESKERYDRVTVKVKVQNVMEKESLADGSIKQDLLVGDSSGVVRVSVWGDCVGKLRTNVSYSLTNFMVRKYFGSSYPTMGRCPMSEVEEIIDIGLVPNTDGGELKRESKSATVVGVDELEKHKCCFRCKGHVEPPGEASGIGKCSRAECGMLQQYEECTDQWSASKVGV